MKHLLIGLLKLYRLVVSPLYGNVCRYYPSCSAYALRAVSVHGAARGSWLAARRLLRCHPWAPGGYDPVPGTPEFAEEERERAARLARAGTMVPDQQDGAPVAPVRTPNRSAPAPGAVPASGPYDSERIDHDAPVASRRGVN